MKFEAGHVAPISNFDSHQFAWWFRTSFENRARRDPRVHETAFSPIALLVPHAQPVEDELEDIYDALGDARVQERFRRGLADAFTALALTRRYEGELAEMLFLGQRIEASEIIDSLAQTLLAGGRLNDTTSYSVPLYAVAFDFLASFYLPSARSAIRTLLASGRLDPKYSVKAFLALCRDFESWSDYLADMRALMAQISDARLDENVVLTAHRFVNVVPLNCIAANILNLQTKRDGCLDTDALMTNGSLKASSLFPVLLSGSSKTTITNFS